jgi:hypothetical protein
MRKLYHKLCDINRDIKKYKNLQRKHLPGSKEHNEIAKEIEHLKSLKEKLSKRNKGNAAYWHNGIPPAEVKKSKPLSEQAKRQKERQFLKKEIEFYTDKEQSEEIKEHIEGLKSRLAMI